MLISVPLIILLASKMGDEFSSAYGRFLWPVFLGAWLVLFRFFRLGKRFLIRPAAEILSRDPRPHVLYLRPFDADATAARVPGLPNGPGKLGLWTFFGFGRSLYAPLQFITPRMFFAPPLTEEEQIVRAFSPMGPVIAVGLPDEQLPPLGAARLHIDAAKWQQEISHWICSAKAVVIRVSLREGANTTLDFGYHLSEGLHWELTTVAQLVEPAALFFLIDATETAYAEFHAAMGKVFLRGLPESASGLSRRRAGIRAVIGFNAEWEPRLLPVSRVDTSAFRFARYPLTTAILEKVRALHEGRVPSSRWLSLIGGSAAAMVFAFTSLTVAGIAIEQLPFWNELRPEEGGFSIRLPGPAERSSASDSVVYKVINRGTAYWVLFTPLTRRTTSGPFDVNFVLGELKAHASTIDVREVYGTVVTVATFETDDGADIGEVRLFGRDGRLYVIGAKGPKNGYRATGADTMFDSFRPLSESRR